MLSIASYKDRIMRMKWVPSAEQQASMARIKPPSSVALLVRIDKTYVVYAEQLTPDTKGIVFDINLAAVQSKFTVHAILIKDFTVTRTKGNTDATSSEQVLHEEALEVDVSRQKLTCQVYSKSAKIEPEFLWVGDLAGGISSAEFSDAKETWRQFKPFYWSNEFILTVEFDDDKVIEDCIMQINLYDNTLGYCTCPKHHGNWTRTTRQSYPKCTFEAPQLVVQGRSPDPEDPYVGYQIIAVTERYGQPAYYESGISYAKVHAFFNPNLFFPVVSDMNKVAISWEPIVSEVFDDPKYLITNTSSVLPPFLDFETVAPHGLTTEDFIYLDLGCGYQTNYPVTSYPTPTSIRVAIDYVSPEFSTGMTGSWKPATKYYVVRTYEGARYQDNPVTATHSMGVGKLTAFATPQGFTMDADGAVYSTTIVDIGDSTGTTYNKYMLWKAAGVIYDFGTGLEPDNFYTFTVLANGEQKQFTGRV